MDTDRVRVGTIHSAKGREADHVFVGTDLTEKVVEQMVATVDDPTDIPGCEEFTKTSSPVPVLTDKRTPRLLRRHVSRARERLVLPGEPRRRRAHAADRRPAQEPADRFDPRGTDRTGPGADGRTGRRRTRGRSRSAVTGGNERSLERDRPSDPPPRARPSTSPVSDVTTRQPFSPTRSSSATRPRSFTSGPTAIRGFSTSVRRQRAASPQSHMTASSASGSSARQPTGPAVIPRIASPRRSPSAGSRARFSRRREFHTTPRSTSRRGVRTGVGRRARAGANNENGRRARTDFARPAGGERRISTSGVGAGRRDGGRRSTRDRCERRCRVRARVFDAPARLRIAIDEAIVGAGAFPVGTTAVNPDSSAGTDAESLRPGEPIVLETAPRGPAGYYGGSGRWSSTATAAESGGLTSASLNRFARRGRC